MKQLSSEMSQALDKFLRYLQAFAAGLRKAFLFVYKPLRKEPLRSITDKLFWFFVGVIITHIVHFVYQKSYADIMGDIKLSECIAMIIEDLLMLLFRFLDSIIPVIVAHQVLILVVINLLIITTIYLFVLRIYLRIKNHYHYNAKIKEAETVLDDANQKAKKARQLQEKMTAEFEGKENTLKGELNQKIKKYLLRIKTLEKEQLELKEMNSELMRKIDTN